MQKSATDIATLAYGIQNSHIEPEFNEYPNIYVCSRQGQMTIDKLIKQCQRVAQSLKKEKAKDINTL